MNLSDCILLAVAAACLLLAISAKWDSYWATAAGAIAMLAWAKWRFRRDAMKFEHSIEASITELQNQARHSDQSPPSREKTMTPEQMAKTLELVEQLKVLEEARWSVATADFKLHDSFDRNIFEHLEMDAVWRVAQAIETELHQAAEKMFNQIRSSGAEIDYRSFHEPHQIPSKEGGRDGVK